RVAIGPWLRMQVEGRPGRQLDLAIAELAEPDLRPGQVGQDGDRAAGRVCRLAHALCGKGVALGGAVREVDARHVHPGLDELTDPLDRGRTDGADELGASHGRKGRRANASGIGVSWAWPGQLTWSGLVEGSTPR